MAFQASRYREKAAGCGHMVWRWYQGMVAALCTILLAGCGLISGSLPSGSLTSAGSQTILDLATADQISDQPPKALTLYRSRANPLVVIVDFPSLHAQALALNRVAALVEKAGAPRDRLASRAEIEALAAAEGSSYDRFYLGHDYRADRLAAFFNLGGAGLTAEEQDLRQRLIAAGVLEPVAGGNELGSKLQGAKLQAQLPMQAVITLAGFGPSVAEERAAWLRRLVLDHELAHGDYFTRPAVQAAATSFFRHELTDRQRQAFIGYFGAHGYDTGQEDLMINETQAFLGFTPEESGFGPEALGLEAGEFASLKARLLTLIAAGD